MTEPKKCPDCGLAMDQETVGVVTRMIWKWRHEPGGVQCLSAQLAQRTAERDTAVERAEKAEAEVGRLKDALRPFAKYYWAQNWQVAPGEAPVCQLLRACVPNSSPERIVAQVTIGHFRAAAEAAKEKP